MRRSTSFSMALALCAAIAPAAHAQDPATELAAKPFTVVAARSISEPANQTRLRQLGLQTWLVPTAGFGDVIRTESAMWTPIIRSRKIEAQ